MTTANVQTDWQDARLTDHDIRRLARLSRGLEVISRQFGRRVPLRKVALLIEVSMGREECMYELADRSGDCPSTISADLLGLGDWNRNGTVGHKCVAQSKDPLNATRNCYELTTAGCNFLEELRFALEG